MLNRNLPPVPVTDFSLVPRSDVPRSTFSSVSTYKTTFNASQLIPFFVEEVLPGDYFSGEVTMFVRMATPLFPIMDNLYLETFFFFTPNRILWDNWVKFMGEQKSPGDSISYTIPLVNASGATGFTNYGVADYFGLPVAGGAYSGALGVNALPFRAYNRIYNEWFRDENLCTAAFEYTGDAAQNESNYALRRRAKRPDYFTSALPWPLKGGVSVPLPLGTSAPVKTSAAAQVSGVQQPIGFVKTDGTGAPAGNVGVSLATGIFGYLAGGGAQTNTLYPSNLYADLSAATAATINSLRLAVASQQFLEKDARGGTRYTELLRNHFGVLPEDGRLDRPEYIGGGSMLINTQAIPQTSATGLTGGSTYIGSLGGATVGSDTHDFSYAATEHGFIIGIVNVRGDVTYQQGIHRMWTRVTRFDFYFPTFAFLGEQAIRNDEIYATGTNDSAAWGYQERWAEYRYRPSRITGKFRSYPTSGTLDAWHLSEAFASMPSLNATFIEDQTPIARVVAAGASANNQQFLFDSVWKISATRALPIRSVPGLMTL